MKGTLFAVAVLTLTASCVTTTLTPAGANVRETTNPEAVKGCKYLGQVMGKFDTKGGFNARATAASIADNRFRNRAADLGANVALVKGAETFTEYSVKSGEAYDCTGVTLSNQSQ